MTRRWPRRHYGAIVLARHRVEPLRLHKPLVNFRYIANDVVTTDEVVAHPKAK